MRVSIALATTTAGAAMIVTACGADTKTDTDPAFTRSDSVGIELLVTQYPDTSPSSGWSMGPEPSVMFGAADPRVEFYRVNGTARLASDRVAVLDYGDKLLRIFEPEGSLAFTAGGEGDGPGEFQSPWGPVPLGGDTVLVFDQRHQRFSVFGPDGAFVGDHRLDVPALTNADLSQYAPADVVGDTVLMIPTRWTMRPSDEPGRFTLEVPMLRYRLDGSFLSEMAEPTTIELEQRGSMIGFVTFTLPTRAVTRSGRVYVIDRSRYEVRTYPHDDGLARIYRLERPRRAVTDGDVDTYVEDVLESAQGSEGGEERIREHYANAARADSFPSLTYAQVDECGNVWVSEYRPPWEDGGSTWAVFAADGRWLGTAGMPEGFTPFHIGDDSALGILIDDLGVQQVVEYPVHRVAGD